MKPALLEIEGEYKTDRTQIDNQHEHNTGSEYKNGETERLRELAQVKY